MFSAKSEIDASTEVPSTADPPIAEMSDSPPTDKGTIWISWLLLLLAQALLALLIFGPESRSPLTAGHAGMIAAALMLFFASERVTRR